MLTFSEYKKWQPECDKSFYKRFDTIFNKEPNKDKKANRIYLNTDITLDYELPVPVHNFLLDNNYTVTSLEKGLCTSNASSTEEAFDKKVTEIKIGRVLTKLKRPDLLKLYTDNRNYVIKDHKLLVVISRHPYDLIGMSTHRRWTTCHDLHDEVYHGKYHCQLQGFLNYGCLIAYLIRDDDKQIKDPLARLLIKPYGNTLTLASYYGISAPLFKVTVNSWLKKIDNSLR